MNDYLKFIIYIFYLPNFIGVYLKQYDFIIKFMLFAKILNILYD